MNGANTIVVNIDDLKKILEFASAIDVNPYSNPVQFFEIVKDFGHSLDLSFKGRINEFSKSAMEFALLIQGLPVKLPSETKTPLQRVDRAPKADCVSEVIISAIGFLLGEPFSFREENLGHLVQNLFPVKNDADLQISSNAVELTMHVDGAFHPCPPDYTLLLCLRTRPGQSVHTFYSSIRRAINNLSCQEIRLTKHKMFILEQELTYGGGKLSQVAIWSSDGGNDIFRFDDPLMKGSTNEYQEVVNNLKNALLSAQYVVHLEPGDLLILKNTECVHSRSAYTPEYDGADRWLQRMFVSRMPEKIRKYKVSPYQISIGST